MSLLTPSRQSNRRPNGQTSREYNAKQGSVFLISSDGRTLQLPIPSRSPNDPLNWSSLKRFCALGAMYLFTIIGLVQVQGTSLLLRQLANEYTVESMRPFRLDMLSSIPSMFWGIGALIWVPLSMAIGRRPVFLFCALLLIFSTLLAAVSGNFYYHLGARCLQGLAGAFSPSAMLLMIIDVTYIHQRPTYIAFFWCICGALSNCGLAATPYIVSAGESWRKFYWAWSPPCVLAFFLALFWCPETYFQRPAMAFDGYILSQSESGGITVYSNWEEVPGGKPMPDEPQVWRASSVIKNGLFWNRTKTGGWGAMRACRRQLLICALNPLIFWVLILNTVVIGGMVVTVANYVELLQTAPYNFTFHAVGIAKFGNGIGALLAFPASGILTSKVVRALAARNRGVREPEHYLPSFILPVITSTVSLALYGIAAQRQWDWRLILLFSGLDYFSAISIFVSSVLWVTEAFPRWAGPALVIVGAGSYGVSFGMSSAIGPWIKSEGLGKTYIELAIVTLVVGVIGLPVNLYGKRFREYIYSRWGEESEADAL